MKAFFSPAGCAVVGASRDAAKPGHQMILSMLDAGFPPDRLFPVHPSESEIAGLPAYPSLRVVPAPVELAVIMVPPHALDSVLADVAARARDRGDLKAIIVTAGGYAELGTDEGRARQAKLVACARAAGVRLMGPNCVGVIDTHAHVDTTFLHGVVRRPGPITFVSQSGAVGAWFLQMLSSEPEPVGFAKFVSLGNMADVTVAETLDYLRSDDATSAVGLYLEGTAEPRPLLRAVSELAAVKPVVVLKTGRTESGRQAATSHTGALAGPDRVWEGALEQAGALRVDRMEEFVDTLRVLAGPARRFAPAPPRPLRVFLVTHAGGPGVYTMDLLAARPGLLEAAVVTPETRAALVEAAPALSSVCRPEGHVDMTASATPEQHAAVVRLLLADANVDALVTLDLPIRFLSDEDLARALAEAGGVAREAGAVPRKLFLPVLMHGKWSAAGRAILERAGLTALPNPDRAVTALVNVARWTCLRAAPGGVRAFAWERPEDVPAWTSPGGVPVRERPGDVPASQGKGGGRPPAGPSRETGGTLNEAESAALLAGAGVGFVPSRLVGTKEQALEAAAEIGYPVVLKLCSRFLPHKVAVGAVRLGLADPGGLARAYDELAQRAALLLGEEGRPDELAGGPPGRALLPRRLDGFLVQAQAPPGREVIVGVLRDALFGPVVAAGPGGTRVGLEAPLRFRLAPLSAGEASRLAEEMVGSLAGTSAGPAASATDLDAEALARVILGLSDLVANRPDVAEADLNPVILYPRGRGFRDLGAVAVDALVRLEWRS